MTIGRVTQDPSDPRPYAEFILQRMLKQLPAFPGATRAVAETENPIEGDNWFWADDNAKVLELLGLPSIWRERRAEVGDILRFLRAMCDGPFIFRRIASPRFATVRRDGGSGEFLHSLMNIGCDLRRGSLTLGMRFHDGRTARNVEMTGNYVRFGHRSKVYTVDVEDNIGTWSIEENGDTRRFIWNAEIEFGGRPFGWRSSRLGTLTYTTVIRADSMFVDVEAALQLAPGIRIDDAVLTFGYDKLSPSESNIRYEMIRAVFRDRPPLLVEGGAEGLSEFRADGASYWSIAQKSQMTSFALAVHSLPQGASPIHAIRTVRSREGRLHWVVSEHRFAGSHEGSRLVAKERKIITAGGFYNDPEAYADMLVRHSRGDGAGSAIDLSVSYDYGAEVRAFARCFRSLSGPDLVPADAVMRDELHALVDSFHRTYQARFIAPYRENSSAIFSRSLAFMAFAYADMIAATGDPTYRAALREACEIILTFERRNQAVDGSIQSGFLMGQVNDSLPYVDCHSSCLLALARGVVLLDEPRWLTSIDLGLAAYRLDTIKVFFLGDQKQDVAGVDYQLPDGSRRTLDTFWNFNAGLTLRLFNAMRAATHEGLRAVWAKHAPRLDMIEMVLRYRIERSQRSRDGTIEILSSMLSAETNSETQPWVALALIGEQASEGAAAPCR